MNKFTCYDCGYAWLAAQHLSSYAQQPTCPRCGGIRAQSYAYNLAKEIGFGIVLSPCSLLYSSWGYGQKHTFQKWMTD